MSGTPELPTKAMVVRQPIDADPMLALVERAARDPGVDVEKMEKLLAMAEKVHARKAESEYDAAMNAAQSEMRPVANDSDNPQTRSRYASYGALDRAVRPIYTEHGFSLSFGTRSPSLDRVTVTCRISHRAGHTERVEIDMPADGKGAKGGDVMTKTHATGSAVSYGMRYLLKMIFNIAAGEYDDDGNLAGKKQSPQGTQSHPPVAQPPRQSGPPTPRQAAAAPLPAAAQSAKAAPDIGHICPKCRATATKESKEWDGMRWCQRCGWQWEEVSGEYFEGHPWNYVICTRPPAGMKLADYRKAPQTLGQIARLDSKRWFGICMNTFLEECKKGYTSPSTGKHYPASQAELAFGQACEDARAYLEAEKAKKENRGDDERLPEPPPDDWTDADIIP